MLRRSLVILPLAAAVAVPSVAAAAPRLHPQSVTSTARAHAAKASPHKSRVKLPVVSSISPRHIALGQTLTIRGHNFIAGKKKNTVVFQRNGMRAVFVTVGTASHTAMRVVLPAKLKPFLTSRAGEPQPTLFRFKVLSKRFSAKFTKPSRSPIISFSGGGAGGGGTPSTGCDTTGHSLTPAGDADHDLLSNAVEASLGTNPCAADSDSDGITDGYEYQAGRDYNSNALPYPGKRPYPNALDPTDGNTDHDGDGLTLRDEYTAWTKYGHNSLSPLVMSDGTQNSGGVVAPPVGALSYLNMNGNSILTDDERDIDGDGISNWVEQYGPGSPDWWAGVYKDERPYGLSSYARTDWLDADTDGDGLNDGADDIDHDGYTNVQESEGPTAYARLSGGASDGSLWVNPFNPCLPSPASATCSLHPPIDDPWPPFKTGWHETIMPLLWPRCDDPSYAVPQLSRPDIAPCPIALPTP